ncbi:MAG: hypothetical protein KatS3mg060_1160 [Dehalococcoidia bacterium]|nr:MAG: hypothetical protein KatS3mg060_1160 [Dehalococcoidia bacterium]
MAQADLYLFDGSEIRRVATAAIQGIGWAVPVVLAGQKDDLGYWPIKVNDDGTIRTAPQAFKQVGFSNVALANNATWTSPTASGSDWTRVVGAVGTDRAGTLVIEQSHDDTFPSGRTYLETIPYPDTATFPEMTVGTVMAFSVERVLSYARVRFTNTGGSAQTWLMIAVNATTIVR